MQNFQTRNITAVEIWLLLCMMFVASAIFEYAVLISIRFDKRKQIDSESVATATRNKVETCNKVDRISLLMFVGIYILTVGAYFVVVTQIE